MLLCMKVDAFTYFPAAMCRYTACCREHVQICYECWRILYNSLLLIVTPSHLLFTETIWIPMREILSDGKSWIHVDLLFCVSNKFLFTCNWLKRIHVSITGEILPCVRIPLGTAPFTLSTLYLSIFLSVPHPPRRIKETLSNPCQNSAFITFIVLLLLTGFEKMKTSLV